MTVQELIIELQQYPPESEVVMPDEMVITGVLSYTRDDKTLVVLTDDELGLD